MATELSCRLPASPSQAPARPETQGLSPVACGTKRCRWPCPWRTPTWEARLMGPSARAPSPPQQAGSWALPKSLVLSAGLSMCTWSRPMPPPCGTLVPRVSWGPRRRRTHVGPGPTAATARGLAVQQEPCEEQKLETLAMPKLW